VQYKLHTLSSAVKNSHIKQCSTNFTHSAVQYKHHTLSSAVQTLNFHEEFFSFDINTKIVIVKIKH